MRFRRRLEPNVTVNLVPMIDVVFQLVVFFMVSTSFKITPAIALTLPSSSTSEPVAVSNLVITVSSRDEVYVNQESTSLEQLLAVLTRPGRPLPAEIKSVIVEGDRNIAYELLIEVLDVLRKGGFKAVALRTREGGANIPSEDG